MLLALALVPSDALRVGVHAPHVHPFRRGHHTGGPRMAVIEAYGESISKGVAFHK